MPGDPPICLSELGDTVNLQADYSKWRLGRPSETLGNRIFMRIATKQDAAMEDTSRSFKSGADTANRILRKCFASPSEFLFDAFFFSRKCNLTIFFFRENAT